MKSLFIIITASKGRNLVMKLLSKLSSIYSLIIHVGTTVTVPGAAGGKKHLNWRRKRRVHPVSSGGTDIGECRQ